MATIYEINEQIMQCIDFETGEVIDADKLDALQLEKDKKIENIACWIKNLTKANILSAIGVLLTIGVIVCFVLTRLGIIPERYKVIPFAVFIVGSIIYIACMLKVIDRLDDNGGEND